MRIKMLSKVQQDALTRMKPATWYSIMDIKVSLEALEGLFEKGLLYRKVTGLGAPYSNILFCKKVK